MSCLRQFFSLFILLVLIGGSSVEAAIIFDNGSIGPPQTYGANFSQGSNRLADNFALAGPDTIRSVQFWGSHWSNGVIPNPDSFSIVIYGDAGGVPNPGNIIGSSALTLVSRIDTGMNHNEVSTADIWEYTMDLVSPISIPNTSTYWLSIFETGTPSGTNFAWQRITGPLGPNAISFDGGVSWSSSGGGDTAWNISNSFAAAPVPEPASMLAWSLIAGMGAVGYRMRKRPKFAS